RSMCLTPSYAPINSALTWHSYINGDGESLVSGLPLPALMQSRVPREPAGLLAGLLQHLREAAGLVRYQRRVVVEAPAARLARRADLLGPERVHVQVVAGARDGQPAAGAV